MHRHPQWKSKADCGRKPLKDEGNRAKENFVAEQDAAFFAEVVPGRQGLEGGHIILLNPVGFRVL